MYPTFITFIPTVVHPQPQPQQSPLQPIFHVAIVHQPPVFASGGPESQAPQLTPPTAPHAPSGGIHPIVFIPTVIHPVFPGPQVQQAPLQTALFVPIVHHPPAWPLIFASSAQAAPPIHHPPLVAGAEAQSAGAFPLFSPPQIHPVFPPQFVAPPQVHPIFAPQFVAPPQVHPVFPPQFVAPPQVHPIFPPQFVTPPQVHPIFPPQFVFAPQVHPVFPPQFVAPMVTLFR